MGTAPVPVLSLGGTSGAAAMLALSVTVSASAGEAAARQEANAAAEMLASKSFIWFMGFLLRVLVRAYYRLRNLSSPPLNALPTVTFHCARNTLRASAFRNPCPIRTP